MPALRKITSLTTLTLLLSACGGGSGESGTPATLFDNIWFNIDSKANIVFDAGTKTYYYGISQNSVTKDSNQVITYTHNLLVGMPFWNGFSTLLNSTSISNLVYNPYASLDKDYTLTEKRLLTSNNDLLGLTYKTSILVDETANSITTVPYNPDLYKDTAATTIQYTKNHLDGRLLADAIDTQIIDEDDPSLIKLKNSGLTFPTGSIGLEQTMRTSHEDSLFFSQSHLLSYASIAEWKASHSSGSIFGAIFKDMQWQGISFSCLVDTSNVPTGSCAVNYNGKVYDADYTSKGTSNEPYYFLFNQTAADALAAGIKQYFISPTVVATTP